MAKAEAAARDQRRGEQLRREGRQLYKDGRYTRAIERFEAAYEISNDLDLLYSIGVAHQQLHEWGRCLGAFDRYLKVAPLSPKRDRAVNARDNCETRGRSQQVLKLRTNPPGASVYIGSRDQPMKGQTPLEVTLRSGIHQVWIELADHHPEKREIELQKEAPFELEVVMRPRARGGQLFVDSNVVDAQVYLNGDRLRFTPFEVPLDVPAGSYQLVVERSGYRRFKKQIEVRGLDLTRVSVPLSPVSSITTWRTLAGFGGILSGLGVIGLGVMAQQEADDLFKDTPRFRSLSNREVLGYVLGGSLLAAGAGLLSWDLLGRRVPADHRNPRFGQPLTETSAAKRGSLRVGVGFGQINVSGEIP